MSETITANTAAFMHIHQAPHQPATRFVIQAGDSQRRFQYRRRATARATCCKRLRWLAYLTVQVYYDGHYYWCKRGHGCKR